MIARLDYTVIRLSDQDSDRLQALFERCTDFFELTAGQPPEPTAARSEFTDVPVGIFYHKTNPLIFNFWKKSKIFCLLLLI